VELKLPQSLASTSLKQAAGGMLELRGKVDRTVLGTGNAVVVKRILCGKYTTVGQAKPNKKGVYVVASPPLPPRARRSTVRKPRFSPGRAASAM
jgi:hypothetical protein